MSISSKLNQLLIICAKQKVEFHFGKEGSANRIYFSGPPDNKLDINIGDVDDEELESYLDAKIKELEDFFK